MTIKKYLLLILVVAILLFGTRYLVFTKHIEKLNPMSYVYNAPIDQVRKNVNPIFSNGKFHGLDFHVGYNKPEREINKITDSENRDHFFINWFGWDSSGEDSPIYYNWWGGLKLIPSYHIVLDSLSKTQTRIKIESFPKVKAGTEVSLNHLIPYFTSRKVNVKPSTIEEYEVIKLIGQRSGEKKMPPTLIK
ncbi:MAG: hypothetical protein JWQ57_210 [Mucilaginibacter sp.]|nr:hypothetical protein [Mucilaginibacter sp.]